LRSASVGFISHAFEGLPPAPADVPPLPPFVTLPPLPPLLGTVPPAPAPPFAEAPPPPLAVCPAVPAVLELPPLADFPAPPGAPVSGPSLEEQATSDPQAAMEALASSARENVSRGMAR